MITREEAIILSKACNVSDLKNMVPNGQYEIELPALNNPETGFDCTIYRKTGTNEFIVAFTGTKDGQDVAADVALGTEQWKKSRISFLERLKDLHATNISFTGHSLGGAIAQYAAYDYIRQNPNNHADVKLCTFNGLGGMDGLKQMHPTDFSSAESKAIANQIDATHFFTTSSGICDIVARLGGGHLGGNTYEIKMAALNAGLAAIHSAWNDFFNLTIPSNITTPDYLNIPMAQRLASLVAYLGTDGKMTDKEGWFRAAGGAFLAASFLSNDELNQLMNALNPNQFIADSYHVRDLSPLVRLGFAMLGVGALAEGEVIHLMTHAGQMTIKAIEDTVMALEDVVKIVQYACDEATETASEAIGMMREAFMTALDFSVERITRLVGMCSEAVDYTAGKWNELQVLGNQVAGWLNDQFSYLSRNGMGFVNAFFELFASNVYGAKQILSLFNAAESLISPIVLDLDGDGVETTGLKGGVSFDHDGNGFAEQTGWVKGDDGLLVRDRNGNGTIDSGQELFGDQTQLANGTRAANGFQALAELDGNADGKIDMNDGAYAGLQVWQDGDGDGYASADELSTLSEAGIASIHTGYTESTLTDADGNTHRQVGSYTKADGSTGIATDVWFKADKMFTIATERLEVPSDIACLPDLRGFGNVYDLHQAMVRDESGQLPALIRQFIAADDPSVRNDLMDSILFQWTGSDGVLPNSRGPIFDARKLAALENFLGRGFLQGGNPDPEPAAIHPLNEAYTILSESIYGQLMAQSHLRDLYGEITYAWDADTGAIRGELSAVATSIQNELDKDEDSGKQLLSEFVRTMRGLDGEEKTHFASFRESFTCQNADLLRITAQAGRNVIALTTGSDCTGGSGLKDLIEGYEGNDTLSGGAGSDEIAGGADKDTLNGGSGNDTLDGGTGDDSLTGGVGNDLLIGGPGIDYLQGNEGSDTYLFSRGDGFDWIVNNDGGDAGVDTLAFTGGVKRGDVEFIMMEGGELSVRIKDTGEAININRWFSTDANDRLDRFRFSDGEILTAAQLAAQGYQVYGTDWDNKRTGSTSNDRMYGYGGNDTLNGSSGNDALDGGMGDDSLTGEAGDDLLIGGPGSDYLQGNEGSDTYLFSRGDGFDRIVNNDGGDAGVDTLAFTGGVNRDDVEFIMTDVMELSVRIKDTGEAININRWFSTDVHDRLDRFRFSDGEILTAAQLAAQGYQVYGTDWDNRRTGSTSNDRMYGYGGNDTLNGSSGNDTLDGGTGDDSLTGGVGDDLLIGGPGSDYLQGNEGSDTYLFSRGDGFDRIVNNDGGDAGVDTLAFTGGVNRRDVEFIMTDGMELSVRIKDTGEAININRWFSTDVHDRLDRFRFSDGEILTAAQLAAQGYQVYGTDWDNRRTGSTSNDRMYGYGGNDTLNGGLGNDTLDGGTGTDMLCGNAGNDVYLVDNVWDYVGENANEGTDTVLSSVTYSLGNHVERLTLTGRAAINGSGNALNNVLTGNNAANALSGGAGNDTLDGRAGNDTLNGGPGSDLYLFDRGGGMDTISDSGSQLTDVDILRMRNVTVHNDQGFVAEGSPVIVRESDDLYLFLDDANYLRVAGQFQSPDYGVERLEVSEGYYVTRADIENIVNTMSAINNDQGMDAIQKYHALRNDQTYFGALAQNWHPQ